MIIIMLIKRFTLWEFNGSSFEQTWTPSPKDALCKIWLKLAKRFWRRRFFAISELSLFCKEHGHFWIGCFVPKLVETDPVVLERKMKMGKVYRKIERKTNGQQSENQSIFQLRWSKKPCCCSGTCKSWT